EEVMLSPVQAGPGVSAGTVNEFPMPARLCVRQPDRMNSGMAHQPWPLVTVQPGMQLELLPVPGRDGGIDGDPFGRIVAGADELPVLAAPAVGHVVVAEEASGVRVVE